MAKEVLHPVASENFVAVNFIQRAWKHPLDIRWTSFDLEVKLSNVPIDQLVPINPPYPPLLKGANDRTP
jgi:hypothetical protein